jgi:uncharacterized delta-60 repeat protein
MKTRLVTLTCAYVLAAFTYSAVPAPADFDLTFGGGTGKVFTAIANGGEGYAVAVQEDGKIVLAGYAFNGTDNDVALVRYEAGGELDTNFNGTGKVITPIGVLGETATEVAIQNDGKAVVSVITHNGIDNDFAVLRYNIDGSLDNSFGNGGKMIVDLHDDIAFSIAIQSDGKILIAGGGNGGEFAVVRFNTNGTLDTGFNGTGYVFTSIGSGADTGWKVAVQGDGKIVVAGVSSNGSNTDCAVVRYNSNGTLDPTFNGTGKVVTDFAGSDDVGYGLGLQSDGKIVVSGSTGNGSNRDFALVRYNTDGSLDTSFGGTGKVVTDIGGNDDWGVRMALQNDGKILMTGHSFTGPRRDLALVRYNTDGSLDASFGGTGKLTAAIGNGDSIGHRVAVQSDGRIVVTVGTYPAGGNSEFAVVRFEGDLDSDGDGMADIYETGTGVYVSPENTGTSPTNPDTDGDGLSDGAEVYTYHSNPNVRDTDADGFDDGFEVTTGFSPTSAASTPDALSAALPAVEYRFNAALGVSYRIEASFDLANWTTIETPVIGNGGVIRRLYFIDGQPKRFFRSRRN